MKQQINRRPMPCPMARLILMIPIWMIQVGVGAIVGEGESKITVKQKYAIFKAAIYI